MSADSVTPLLGAPVVSVERTLAQVTTATVGTLSATVAGLVAGGQYRFEVQARNGTAAPLGLSAPSAPRSDLVTAQ
jgi:hypothetical protein